MRSDAPNGFGHCHMGHRWHYNGLHHQGRFVSVIRHLHTHPPPHRSFDEKPRHLQHPPTKFVQQYPDGRSQREKRLERVYVRTESCFECELVYPFFDGCISLTHRLFLISLVQSGGIERDREQRMYILTSVKFILG